MHPVEASLAYLPLGHLSLHALGSSEPLATVEKPAGHEVQLSSLIDLKLTLYFPTAQSTQVSSSWAMAALHLPATHSVHDSSRPSTELQVPFSQEMQLEASWEPAVGLYLPLSQLTHSFWPSPTTLLHFPAWQSSHSASMRRPKEVLHFPAAQGLQGIASAAELTPL